MPARAVSLTTFASIRIFGFLTMKPGYVRKWRMTPQYTNVLYRILQAMVDRIETNACYTRGSLIGHNTNHYAIK